jgi:VIT1/CCC1 family predicted Fe2+/Mn2+ transporter
LNWLRAGVLGATLSARLGGASRSQAMARMVIGGSLAMAVPFGIGHSVGAGL